MEVCGPRVALSLDGAKAALIVSPPCAASAVLGGTLAGEIGQLIACHGELQKAVGRLGNLRLRALTGRVSTRTEAAIRAAAARVATAAEKTLQSARALAPTVRPELAAAYKELIDLGRNQVPDNNSEIVAYVADTIDNARATLAQTLGELDEAVGRSAAAVEHYHDATAAWRDLGDVVATLNSAAAARRLLIEQDRDLDAAIMRLATSLEDRTEETREDGTPAAALERATATVELAALYLKGGDSLECSLLLDRARAELPADDMEDSLAPVMLALIDHARTHGSFSRALARQFYAAQRVRLLQCEIAHLELMLHPTSREAAATFDDAADLVQRMTGDLPWKQLKGRVGKLAFAAQQQNQTALEHLGRTLNAARTLAELDGLLNRATADPAELASALTQSRNLRETAFAHEADGRAGSGDLWAIAERMTAEILLRLGEPGQALATCERARDLLSRRRTDVRASVLLTAARSHLALCRIARESEAQHHREQAQRVAAQGMELVEGFRYRASGVYIRDAQLKPWIGLYRLAAEVALELDDPDHFVRLALSSKARRLSWGAGAFGEEAALHLGTLGDMVDKAYGDDREATAVRQIRRMWWDRLLARHQYPPTPVPGRLEIQQRLEPGEAAVLHYWLDEHRLAVTLITSDEFEVVVRPLEPLQRTRLDADVRLLMAEDAATGKADVKARAVLLRLDETYTSLLLPERPERLLDLRRLFISTHGVLHGFPLHALKPDGTAELGAAVPVSYLPNLAGLCDPTPESGPDTMVSLTYEARMPRGQARLDDLADHIRQITDIHTAHGRTVEDLSGAPDRRAFGALLGVPGAERFGVLHLVTHGQNVLSASDSPMEARLWLHASELDGLDVASWHLDGAIVVLTACSSGQRALAGRDEADGSAAPLSGDEVFGLQAGCFAAGANAVLGCLWPVPTTVAAAVTVAFHRELLSGHPPDWALQRAVAAYRADNPGPNGGGNSYKWAPFFLSTRGRPAALSDARKTATEDTA